MSGINPDIRRPDKFEHFLNRAQVAAERGTCLRRRVGAVIIRDGIEVSSGYVGAPRGVEHCIGRGRCLRIESGIPSGERYELCRSVHAEQNAIINAARAGVVVTGGDMYISSEKIKDRYSEKSAGGGEIYGPCLLCIKQIINAGIHAVHMRDECVGSRSYTMDDLKRILYEEEERAKESFTGSQGQ
ncbi:cytidine/deoxycytidylate deaminase family protein [Chloroflexota bacterium]